MRKKNDNKKLEKNKYYIDSSYVKLNEKDYLENYIYSDELSNKISNYFDCDSEKPLYIGVIGSWGSGKTSVVETSLDKFDKEAIIYRYDAWKYEGDSFRRSFIQSILNQSVDKYKLKNSSEIYKNISESLYEDYSISSNSILERVKLSQKKDKKLSFFSVFIVVVVSALFINGGIYYISNNHITLGSILTFLGTLITLFGAMGLFDIFYSTIVYSKSKMFSSEQFYKSFIDILNEVRGYKNIILIDNLDRCSKEELKETLSTIKGLYVENNELRFKNEKIIFIIPLDINSLEVAYEENKIFYLDKIFDDMIYIKQKYNTDKQDFINKILNEYPEINMLVSSNSKSIIINSAINTPREIIKVLNDYVTEYNILLKKNGNGFIENERNRNYLMKSIILKRLYYDFYQLAYSDLEKFIKIEKNTLLGENFKTYKNNEELTSFLTVNKSINPTNYYDFYQNQSIKSYNQIPFGIKEAIMKQDIKTIINYKEKTRIIDYYVNIHDDIINEFWNPNILNKYITLIELIKNNYFDKEESNKIINSWKLIFTNEKFYNLNSEYIDIIGYENELMFGTEIYKNDTFNLKILDNIKNNTYNFANEQEKYEKLSQWISKNNDIALDDSYTELVNSYCEYLLNNNLYSDSYYLKILFGKNIKIMKIDILKQFITINSSNEIILNLIHSIKENQINDIQIIDELSNWLSINQITDINIIITTLNYMIDNNRDISILNINNPSIGDFKDDKHVLYIVDKYIEKNIYNNSLYNILNCFNNKNIIKKILDKLTDNIPNNNEEYVDFFKKYFFNLTIENKRFNLISLERIINKYYDYESIFLEKIIDDKLLNDYYKILKTSEKREHLIEVSIGLLSSDFNKQIENIFVYESSSERMKILMSNHNSIYDYVLVINKMSKKNMKNKLVKEFIEMLKEKDNVTDEEINLINTLYIEDLDKEKFKEILNSKETINKELIGV